MSEDKEWLKGTPFSKWIKRLEKLESNQQKIIPIIDTYEKGGLIGQMLDKITELEKKLEEPIMTLDHSVAIMSINDQLSELKASSASHTEKIKKLQKNDDIIIGEYEKLIIPDDYSNEIKELKEQINVLNIKTPVSGTVDLIEEVLRELMEGFTRYYDKNISYMDLRVILKGLLDKLGGEKTGEEVATLNQKNSSRVESLPTDSKPPSCEHKWGHNLIHGDTCLDCGKRKYPSEQDLSVQSVRDGKYYPLHEKEYDDPDIDKYQGNRKELIKWNEQGDKEVAELVDYDLYSHEGVMVYDAKTQIIVEKEDLERWYYYFCYHDHKQFRKDIREKYLPSEDKE